MPFPMEQINDGSIADKNFRALARDMNPPVPQARVFNSIALVIPTGAVTALTFDSEVYDEGSLHSTSANTGRLTAPITGLYSVGFTAEWAGAAGGTFRQVEVRNSAGTRIALDRRGPVGAAAGPSMCFSTELRLVAGDWVDFAAFQDSGGNLNLGVNPLATAWMHRVGGYVNQGV